MNSFVKLFVDIGPLAIFFIYYKLSGDLIDAINQMTHPTPAGPSGPPVNAAVFSQIKSRLKIILSSKNFVD